MTDSSSTRLPRGSKAGKRQSLQNLKSHEAAYVTIGELAEYWRISRKQIYKQIDAGTLPAIRLGPRLLRIRTVDAVEFERRANMQAPDDNHRKINSSEPPVSMRAVRRR
jgi:excisionase family DNA binding protein